MIIGEEWKDQVSKVTETSIPGQWKKEVKMANKDLDLDLSGAESTSKRVGQEKLCEMGAWGGGHQDVHWEIT